MFLLNTTLRVLLMFETLSEVTERQFIHLPINRHNTYFKVTTVTQTCNLCQLLTITDYFHNNQCQVQELSWCRNMSTLLLRSLATQVTCY